MTSPPTPTPTHQQMPPTPNPAPDPQPPPTQHAPEPEPQPATPQPQAQTAPTPDPQPAPAARPRLFSSESLLIVIGSAIVALLVYNFNTINDRLDRIEDRFAAQDAKIHEIDLKLTALIAGLNMAEQVQAALDGELLVPDPATEPPPPPN